jgi:AcrR family transcriptional regulator
MARRPQQPVPDRILAAATGLAAERPWRSIALGDIAAEAKVTLAQLHGVYRSKTAIVAALMARADDKVLSGIDRSALDEPVHDRLLDVLLRRLDSLSRDKKAIASILRDTATDPLSALCMAPAFLNSMAWTLEAAGIGSAGPGGRIRAKGLAAIYLGALCVWLRDDSPDQGRTMAFLDRRLRAAGRLAAFLPGGHRRPHGDRAAS